MECADISAPLKRPAVARSPRSKIAEKARLKIRRDRRARMGKYARDLLESHPEVEEVIVFGSFENDTYAPASDLDVFVVLREASDSPRDRVPRFLPHKSLEVPVDVFAFTRAEIAGRCDSPPLAAVKKSRWRYQR